jgi:hypothetical protein
VRRGGASGFVPLPKRWIVERTFAWLGRCRQLARDFEDLAVNALAFLCLRVIRLMPRRLARGSRRSWSFRAGSQASMDRSSPIPSLSPKRTNRGIDQPAPGPGRRPQPRAGRDCAAPADR